MEEDFRKCKVKDSPKRLIVDANILFSALIRDSTTRKLIIELPTTLLAPDIIVEEIIKHKKLISIKSRLSEENVDAMLNRILSYIQVLDEGIYTQHLQKAYDIMKDIDAKGSPYVAVALAIKNDGIWSDDTHLEKQSIIKVWKTKDLVEKLR